MSTGETETSPSTTTTAAEEREIIKIQKKIDDDTKIIEQIKDDISKMDESDLKTSLISTKVALEKEKKDNKDIIKNMSLTPLQQRHAEVQKAQEEAGVPPDALLSEFAQYLYPQKEEDAAKNTTKKGTRKYFGGKRKTKRKKRTRRKKRTKRRHRRKRRRTRRKKRTKRRHRRKRRRTRRRIR
jgi:hypothetical protein